MITYLTFPICFALLMQSVAAISSGGFDFSPLINVGGIGVVLAWLLWKLEPRMRAMEGAIDRYSRTMLIMLLEIKGTSSEGKRQSEVIVAEIDEAARQRNPKKEV